MVVAEGESYTSWLTSQVETRGIKPFTRKLLGYTEHYMSGTDFVRDGKTLHSEKKGEERWQKRKRMLGTPRSGMR
jgi:hypothetical protein